MAYITLDEAKQFLGDIYESAYENIQTNIPDETILQNDINKLSFKIDGYLQAAYSQTITNPNALLQLQEIMEALLLRKAYTRFLNSEVPEAVQADHDESMKTLRDIAAGVAFLTDETQTPRSSSVEYEYNDGQYTGTEAKVFTRQNMAGW